MRIDAAKAQLDTATALHDLASDLKQAGMARNRFAAGIASNIEVVEAHAAVATATDNRISGLYTHNVAKRTRAYAVGTGEANMTRVPGAQR